MIWMEAAGLYIYLFRRFWQELNEYEADVSELKSKSDSVRSRCQQDEMELEQLNHTNVYSMCLLTFFVSIPRILNADRYVLGKMIVDFLIDLSGFSSVEDAFCIGCEGGVATINGLRLGRLPEVQVSERG